MPAPDPNVLLAIQSGQTTVTRRCDIYESDGVTPWMLNAPMRSDGGSVTVDYTRDERRNMDIVLDNSAGTMRHGPGNLWYDKIIKLYRGVSYTPEFNEPRFAVIDPDGTNTMLLYLTSLGYTDIQVFTSAGVSDLLNFDIVAFADNGTADMSTATSATLVAAYKAGLCILTCDAFATPTTVPLISVNHGSITYGATNEWDVNPPATDTPFSRSFKNVQIFNSGITGYTSPFTWAPNVFNATVGWYVTNSTVYGHAGSMTGYTTDQVTGARWFHWNAPLKTTQGTLGNTQWAYFKHQRDILMTSIIQWLAPQALMQSWETQIGEFMIDKIVTPRAPRNVHITGRDYCKKLKNSKFDNATSFPPGQLIDILVQDIAANAGITKFRLGAQGALTTSTNTFDSTSARWDALNSMCQAANIELFFDAYGYLVTRPFLDPTTSPVTLLLQTGGEFGNLVDWELSSDDSELYNRIVVSGISDDSSISGAIYQGIAENHEPSSPTSIENLGQTRDYFYTSSFFTSNAQCQAYAQTLLSYHALESFEMDYTSLVFAWLEAGEIIECDIPNAEPTDPTRFLSVSFTIPLSLDPMTGVAKRVTVVG